MTDEKEKIREIGKKSSSQRESNPVPLVPKSDVLLLELPPQPRVQLKVNVLTWDESRVVRMVPIFCRIHFNDALLDERAEDSQRDGGPHD